MGEFNAYSPDWILHWGKKRNAAGLEALIEGRDLILNNEPRRAIRPT